MTPDSFKSKGESGVQMSNMNSFLKFLISKEDLDNTFILGDKVKMKYCIYCNFNSETLDIRDNCHPHIKN